ncbi:uncharacterized protein N7483_003186 [Penicillium malachiteum]|uniref:uncharacterized protein n=1 Tax=Penicillium malachiteum TaxID=1324776 RepID=UPI002548733B|nr:uncharacterized protein N7483_003186 [Penicillium malachiteum]KAJ5728678.1 hypothetical protein N7483_003186 [Penicillium malachiteum]
MADYPSNTPDLSSVLQTLSTLASQNNQSQSQSQAPEWSHSNSSAQSKPHIDSNIPAPRTTSQSVPRRHPSSSSKPASTPTVDPSTITTWPAALRYVMRSVGQNEETQLRVRGLIRSQHSHEQQWWNGRQALLQRQQARGDKKKELDEVLRSIGAPVDSANISTAQEDKAELMNYDFKIYKASVKMADALMAELRGLNIPFFVLRKEIQPSSSKGESEALVEGPPKLSDSELADLQRRMLELLEDLCKE